MVDQDQNDLEEVLFHSLELPHSGYPRFAMHSRQSPVRARFIVISRPRPQPHSSRRALATIDQFLRFRSSHSGRGERSGLCVWTRVARMPRSFLWVSGSK